MHEIRIVASLPTLPRVGRVAPEKTSTKTDAILARLSERECAEAVNHVHARSTNTSLPNVAPVLNCEAVPS